MSKNFCWGCQRTSEERKSYHVVLFVSRNKDNHDIIGFKERRKAMFCEKNLDRIYRKFNAFVNDGVAGEMSRLYISVNARDEKKVQKALIHELIDAEDFNFTAIEGVVAGIAARKENATEHKWMFDFDNEDVGLVNEFIKDIYDSCADIEVKHYVTPHGYAIVVDKGFDTRQLMEKWKDIVSLKRDDLLCYDYRLKVEEIE